MLKSIKKMEDFDIKAKDGNIGNVADFYFDDQKWIIRYLVVETGNWISRNQVLIPTYALGQIGQDEEYLNVNLTKEQVEKSPAVSTNKPVSRQKEEEMSRYYQYPPYWEWDMGMAAVSGADFLMASQLMNQESKADKQESEPEGDPHLRSSKEVTGYSIQGKNDAIGHVEDFIVDDKTWIVRYMVVDTGRKIFGGRKVLIAPHWIDKVDWAESKVFVALSTQSIKESPEYDSSAILNRDYEEILYEHYGLPKYWI